MTTLKVKAQNLLIELKSLETCDAQNNRIGTYNLLNEVLKDAKALAHQAKACPVKTAKELRTHLDELSRRSRAARARSNQAIERCNIAMARAMPFKIAA